MPIGKSLKTYQARQTIEHLLNKTMCKEHQKNECGKVLDDLGRKYGYDTPNQLVVELDLTNKLGIPVVCPIQDKVKSKIGSEK